MQGAVRFRSTIRFANSKVMNLLVVRLWDRIQLRSQLRDGFESHTAGKTSRGDHGYPPLHGGHCATSGRNPMPQCGQQRALDSSLRG